MLKKYELDTAITKVPDMPKGHVQPNESDIEWLRQYKMHQENLLYSRINIFLLSLSLIAAISITVTSSIPIHVIIWLKLLPLFVSFLGLSLTWAWWFAVSRQRKVVAFYSMLQKKYDPFYDWGVNVRMKIEENVNKVDWHGQSVLVHFLPFSFLLFWIISFLWAFDKYIL